MLLLRELVKGEYLRRNKELSKEEVVTVMAYIVMALVCGYLRRSKEPSKTALRSKRRKIWAIFYDVPRLQPSRHLSHWDGGST